MFAQVNVKLLAKICLFLEFIKFACDKGISMAIVSHKTKHPFIGPKYDLHEAARGWVANTLMDGVTSLIEPDHVFFELTKEEKKALKKKRIPSLDHGSSLHHVVSRNLA